MTEKAILEVARIDSDTQEITFNMVFLDSGEIRQKKRSFEWLMKRIFYHELRTWKKNKGKIVEYDLEAYK
jgi:hypothetical protein